MRNLKSQRERNVLIYASKVLVKAENEKSRGFRIAGPKAENLEVFEF